MGSPPRMRGKGQDHLHRRVADGITPAYAGKSPKSRPATGPERDHPRVCGEKSMMSRVLLFMVGSPPRMRGKVKRNKRFQLADGITPAYAGKRPAAWAGAWRTGDHPRVCGEKGTGLTNVTSPMGSPPRMRGKVVHFFGAHLPDGITPAYAGKSRSGRSGTASPRDHPRVCGEKIKPECPDPCISGSPPRMRGKAFCKNRLGLQDGITPAYAGKRRAGRTFENCNRDHPRVCGEKHRRHRATNRPMGSPPRMRGKVRRSRNHVPRTRITPACAGKRAGTMTTA